jgi:hypothetical protein
MKRSQVQKIRERLFPDTETFVSKGGGYVPLPIVLRHAQFLFSPREWQIYTYVLMRSGPDSVAWFTLQELAWDLDFRSIPKLKPYVDKLVDAGWLKHQTSQGKDYYIAPEPLSVFRARRDVPQERIDAMDELIDLLKKEPRRRDQDLASNDAQEGAEAPSSNGDAEGGS